MDSELHVHGWNILEHTELDISNISWTQLCPYNPDHSMPHHSLLGGDPELRFQAGTEHSHLTLPLPTLSFSSLP